MGEAQKPTLIDEWHAAAGAMPASSYDYQKAMRDAGDALAECAEQMVAILTEAAQTFRKYEAMHESKGTVEGAQKAAANAFHAKRCEAVLMKILQKNGSQGE